MESIIGMPLYHEQRGAGTLKRWDGKTITVQFKDKEVCYQFPEAFYCGLSTTNTEDEARIQALIRQYNASHKGGLSSAGGSGPSPLKAQGKRADDYFATRGRGGLVFRIVAAVFMTLSCLACVISCIIIASEPYLEWKFLTCVVSLVPLAWSIPMTVYGWRLVQWNDNAGTAFKVCTFLFFSIPAGICLFIADAVD